MALDKATNDEEDDDDDDDDASSDVDDEEEISGAHENEHVLAIVLPLYSGGDLVRRSFVFVCFAPCSE
jgi:hypothetical protein